MSELSSPDPVRRRRADAARSITAILDAAITIFGERPEASIDQVAVAAGVSRQTVYAHYPSREALQQAVIDHVMAEILAELDAARLDEGPATEALLRLVGISWEAMRRYPILLHADARRTPQESRDHLRAIHEWLDRLLRRGQQTGEIDPEPPATWLSSVFVALTHTAVEHVSSGRMDADEAAGALRLSLLRVMGAERGGGQRRGEPA